METFEMDFQRVVGRFKKESERPKGGMDGDWELEGSKHTGSPKRKSKERNWIGDVIMVAKK